MWKAVRWQGGLWPAPAKTQSELAGICRSGPEDTRAFGRCCTGDAAASRGGLRGGRAWVPGPDRAGTPLGTRVAALRPRRPAPLPSHPPGEGKGWADAQEHFPLSTCAERVGDSLLHAKCYNVSVSKTITRISSRCSQRQNVRSALARASKSNAIKSTSLIYLFMKNKIANPHRCAG